MILKNTSNAVIDYPYGDRHLDTVHIDPQGTAECPDEIGFRIVALYPFVVATSEAVIIPAEEPEVQSEVSAETVQITAPEAPKTKRIYRKKK